MAKISARNAPEENNEASDLDVNCRHAWRRLDEDKENSELRKLFKDGRIQMKYSSLSGSAVVDGHKGRPPTKKEREQGYNLVNSIFDLHFLSQLNQEQRLS